MKVEMFEVKFTCLTCGKTFPQEMCKEAVEREEVKTCFTCMAPMIQGEVKYAGSIETDLDVEKEPEKESKDKESEVWLPHRQTRVLDQDEFEVAEAVFGCRVVEVADTATTRFPAVGFSENTGSRDKLQVKSNQALLLPKEEADPFSNKQKEEELDKKILDLYAEEAKEHARRSKV